MQDQENETPVVEEEQVEEEEVVTSASESEQPALKTDEIIEVEWPQVEQLFKINQYAKQLDSQLADLCLRYEKTKQNLLSRLSECETFLYNSGTTLKDSQGIDPSVSYELKLPKEEGEKAFFIRKDA